MSGGRRRWVAVAALMTAATLTVSAVTQSATVESDVIGWGLELISGLPFLLFIFTAWVLARSAAGPRRWPFWLAGACGLFATLLGLAPRATGLLSELAPAFGNALWGRVSPGLGVQPFVMALGLVALVLGLRSSGLISGAAWRLGVAAAVPAMASALVGPVSASWLDSQSGWGGAIVAMWIYWPLMALGWLAAAVAVLFWASWGLAMLEVDRGAPNKRIERAPRALS